MRVRLSRRAFILVAAVGIRATGWTADGSWNLPTGGNWSTAGNWVGGTIADGSGNTASFTNAVGSDVTVTNDSGTRVIGNLQFGNSANSYGNNWTITNNTLNLAGGAPTVTVNTNSATVASILSGSSGLIKNGQGTLTLTARNSFTGTNTIREGTLALADPTGGNLTLNGQTVVLTNGVLRWNAKDNVKDTVPLALRGGTADLQGYSEFFGGLTLSGNALFTGSTNNWFSLNGTEPGDVTTEGDGSAGTISASMSVASKWSTVTGNRTQSFNIATGTSLTVSGAIVNDNSGGGYVGSVSKVGGGTLTLTSRYNTYSGTTTVREGVLALAEATGHNGTVIAPIVVQSNGVLRWNTTDNIKDTAMVALRGGTADLQGYTDYFGGLTLSSNALFTGSSGNWFILNGTSPGEVATEGVGNAGTIAANMAIAAQWGSFTNNRTQPFNIAAGTSLTVSGSIANDNSGGGKIGSILKTGAGTLTLSAANTYSGGTLVSNGVIVVGSDLAFGTNLVTLAGGGLSVTNVTRVTANLFSLIQDAAFDVQTGATWTSFGTVTNSGKLVKTGGGALTIPLMGACKVVVAGGTLKLPVSIPSGTVACYTFNNPGALGADSSTNANTLVTATGSPAYTNSGRYGGALYLDGASTMNKGGVFPTGVPTGGSPYTIALWEKDNGSGDRGGFVGWGNSVNYQCNNLRFNGNNQLDNYWYGNDWTLAGLSTNPKDGNWHHLAVTWDGATQTMYVDGKPVGTSPRTGLNAQAANFVVGKTTADVNFKGWIDDLLIANRALSSNEVVNLLNYSAAIVQNSTNDSARIDAGCTLDLSGNSQTFASLSGSGAVTGGTLTVTSALTPGGTNAVGTLSVAGNLEVGANAAIDWNYGDSGTKDLIQVTGTLTLPATATVNISRVTGSSASLPKQAVILTGSAPIVRSDFSGWSVTGAGSSSRVRAVGNQVLVITPTGTLLRVF